MTKIAYRRKTFSGAGMTTLRQAQSVIDNYQEQGYTLTLRQLYYQLVAGDLISNSEKEYKRLGRIITDARESGRVSWTAIEDRGRRCYGPPIEEDPSQLIRNLEHELIYDLWARQEHYVEVWVEKQALESVVQHSASRLRVPYMACKGYLSASEAWRAGQRFQRAKERDQHTVLIHLADHDPSGIDMTRDNDERLSMFARHGVEVRRIALNMDQVREYSPPPNPAKVTDSRAADYIRRFGKSSWELDALNPPTLHGIIEGAVYDYCDPEAWDAAKCEEDEAREELYKLGRHWEQVREHLKTL